MPNYIVKLSREGRDYYLEWSTVVDAPTTFGMPLEEFKEYYQEEYGRDGIRGLAQRLERVGRYGTSSILRHTPEDLVNVNRAGVGESRLTMDEVIDWYCIRREEPKALANKNPVNLQD